MTLCQGPYLEENKGWKKIQKKLALKWLELKRSWKDFCSIHLHQCQKPCKTGTKYIATVLRSGSQYMSIIYHKHCFLQPLIRFITETMEGNSEAGCWGVWDKTGEQEISLPFPAGWWMLAGMSIIYITPHEFYYNAAILKTAYILSYRSSIQPVDIWILFRFIDRLDILILSSHPSNTKLTSLLSQ